MFRRRMRTSAMRVRRQRTPRTSSHRRLPSLILLTLQTSAFAWDSAEYVMATNEHGHEQMCHGRDGH